MSKLLVSSILFSIFYLSAHPAWADATECLVDRRTEHGNMCGSDKNSVKLYYSNGCSKQVDFKICLQRQDGTANCGITTLNPGNSSSSWGCGVTGRYWWQGRVSGSGEKFANESEINWNLR